MMSAENTEKNKDSEFNLENSVKSSWNIWLLDSWNMSGRYLGD